MKMYKMKYCAAISMLCFLSLLSLANDKAPSTKMHRSVCGMTTIYSEAGEGEYSVSGMDTIKAIMLISDTADKALTSLNRDHLIRSCDTCTLSYEQTRTLYKDNNAYWISGYEVVNVQQKIAVIASDNPNYIMPDGSSTLLGTVPRYEKSVFYIHISYLDQDKKVFSPNVVVWQSIKK